MSGVRRAITIVVVTTIGCSSGSTAPGPDPDRPDGSLIEAAADTAADPASALDEQIAWLIDTLNGTPADADAVAARFSEEFLSVVSAEQLATNAARLRGVANDWTVEDVHGDGFGASVRLSTDSGPWLMLLAVDASGDIDHLVLEPDLLAGKTAPTSFDEIVQRLEAVGDVSVLAADVSDGGCEEIFSADADVARPIGSDFKLYVLAALVDAIGAGEPSWTDPLVIVDELKSLPSGVFRDLEAGTTLTVRDFASAMIATSDNTATDHLIDLLGRRAVEAAQAAYGHSDPERNVPFLTTRELFTLKLSTGEDRIRHYIRSSSAERLDMLESEIAAIDPNVQDALDWTEPRAIDEVEWFASPLDLCRVLVGLHAGDTATLALIKDILATNPGAVFNADDWSYVGFKGGSEPGVLSLAWILEGSGGRYVYVVNVTNQEQMLPQLQIVDLARAGFDLLAQD